MVVHSPFSDIVIPDISFAEYMLERIKQYGNDVALIDNTRKDSMTFQEVYDQVRCCSVSLQLQGLRKGDIVAICSSNRNEYLVVILASIACGAVVTTCNPLYNEDEILQQFSMSKPKVIFCESLIFERIKNVSSRLPTVKNIFTFGATAGCISYTTLLKLGHGKEFVKPTLVASEDLCLLPYSSGTTGLPKGVMMTHRAVLVQQVITRVHLFMNRSNCFYMVVPMFHTFGFSMSLYCLMVGAKNVFDPRFSPERMLQAVEKHKVTHFSGVPPIMLALAETTLRERYNTSSLQRVICGAAPIAPTLSRKIATKYNVIVTPCYGLTEMVPISYVDTVVQDLSSVGTICCNTSVKVIDITSGTELGEGEDGEILAKGPQMMKGYLGNPNATARTIDKQGWIHTGDIGHYDKNGVLYVTGRLKELIKYKGFQVAPAELEAILLTHPGIADVGVIGVPDAMAGEVPKAFIVKKDPNLRERDVSEFIKRKLAGFKHLRGGVQFTDEIPKSPSGKILRNKLREKNDSAKPRM